MIQKEKELADKDLQAAMPALIRAQQAVDDLKAADIVEMKTNKNPGDVIKYIMDSVVIFCGGKLNPIIIEQKIFNKKEGKEVPYLKDSYEESGRALLSDMKFLTMLKEYKKDNINDETIELLEPYMA